MLIKWVHIVIGKFLSSVTALHSCPLSPPAVLRVSGFTEFSDDAKVAAPELQPTLEAALRKYAQVRCPRGCQHRVPFANRIKSQAVFIALDQTVEGVTETLKEAFGGGCQPRLSPTNENLLNSSQHGKSARFSLRPRTELMLSPGRAS